MSMNLENIVFELNMRTRDTVFFIDDTEDGFEFWIDCSFESNEIYEEEVAPSLCINPTFTNANNKEELVGMSFSVDSVEQADEREDTLYLFEHEPLEKYQLTILDIDNDRAHIECKGIAITDGYTVPYVTGKFEINCWLPIITNVSDWDKFDL